jgi:hypothetical protein
MEGAPEESLRIFVHDGLLPIRQFSLSPVFDAGAVLR